MMYHMRLEQQFLTRQLTGEEAASNWEVSHRNSISSFLCLMLPYLGIYNPGRSSHGKAFCCICAFCRRLLSVSIDFRKDFIMTVYTCSPDLASILTCIYEAWNSRLGYRNVRLMTEPVGNLELFCDYCHVEPDTEKAASVTRSIQKKIGAAAWRLVYLCAMSERSDAPDIIYRFLLYGFSYGKDTLHMLQEPAVFHAFEVSRQVTNEAHSFREFIRFANISSGFPILVSHISPKANVLTWSLPIFLTGSPQKTG